MPQQARNGSCDDNAPVRAHYRRFFQLSRAPSSAGGPLRGLCPERGRLLSAVWRSKYTPRGSSVSRGTGACAIAQFSTRSSRWWRQRAATTRNQR